MSVNVKLAQRHTVGYAPLAALSPLAGETPVEIFDRIVPYEPYRRVRLRTINRWCASAPLYDPI